MTDKINFKINKLNSRNPNKLKNLMHGIEKISFMR